MERPDRAGRGWLLVSCRVCFLSGLMLFRADKRSCPELLVYDGKCANTSTRIFNAVDVLG